MRKSQMRRVARFLDHLRGRQTELEQDPTLKVLSDAVRVSEGKPPRPEPEPEPGRGEARPDNG